MAFEVLTDQQLIDLLSQVLRLTKEGRLSWRKGKNDYHFVAVMRTHELSVSSQDDDDLAPFWLAVRRREDQLRIAYVESDLDSEDDVDVQVNATLADLYNLVKGTTLGLADAADKLFGELREFESG